MWLVPSLGRFTPRERDPVPIIEEAEWAPGPVWKGAENLASTGIRSQDFIDFIDHVRGRDIFETGDS